MRLISIHQGQLVAVNDPRLAGGPPRGFYTALPAMDAIIPPGGMARGAVHELLHRAQDPAPTWVALILGIRVARRTAHTQFDSHHLLPTSLGCPPPGRDDAGARPIVWIDPARTLYPPAVFEAGVDPRHLWIVHPRDEAENLWATAESLRCGDVAATIASPPWLSRTDARRLQLAAEQGGGVGLFMRRHAPHTDFYAAATRWLVQPARGERTIQRWKLTLLHGHGGQVGACFLLEHSRETNTVHSTAELVDRSGAAAVIPA